MYYFSDRIADTIPDNLKISPSLLRLLYISEVFNYFTKGRTDILGDLHPFDEYPLSLQELSDEICIQLKHETLTHSKSDHYLFLTDLIRTCEWSHFYDIVEIVGHKILLDDLYILKTWDDLVDRGIDTPDEYGFDPFFAKLRLDNYGFEVYISKVNGIFQDLSSHFRIDDSGSLFVSQSTVPLNNIHSVQAAQFGKDEVVEPHINVDIDGFLNLAGQSKIFEKKDLDEINTCIDLFKEKHFVTALTSLFKCIEGTINKLVKQQGGDYRNYREVNGLRGKLDWLAKKETLPEDIMYNVEFVTLNRNKIAHGDLAIKPELAETVFWYTIRWYRMLLGSIK